MAINKGTLALGLVNGVAPFLFIRDGITGKLDMPLSAAFTVAGTQCNSARFNPQGTTLAVGAGVTPYINLYGTATWAKLNNPAVLPAGLANGVAWSPDGSLLAVAHTTTPFVTIYNTTTWAKLTNPAVLPAGAGQACAFNPAGTKLAVGHATTPFLTVYDTTTWAKQADPAVLPTAQVNGADYSADGNKVAVGMSASPFVHVYNTSDMSKVANPGTLPTNVCQGLRFSPDSAYLAAACLISPLRLYKVSDWSSLAVAAAPIQPSAYTSGNDVAWLSGTLLWLSTTGSPGLVQFLVGTSAAVAGVDYLNGIDAIDVVRTTGWKLDGTISESLAADTWLAEAYDHLSGALLGSVQFTGTTFSIPLANVAPVKVTVSAKQGTVWEASKAVALNTKEYPTNPSATPFYYNCTTAGTTGSSEPSWPILSGGTVTDGTVVWTLVERLIEPSTQGPLIPIPA